MVLPRDAAKEEIIAAAKADPKVAGFIVDKALVKEIYVPGKMVNLLVK